MTEVAGLYLQHRHQGRIRSSATKGQCGTWTAKNILAEIAGETRTAFHYHDKGIMAMIGRNAAVAAIGKKRARSPSRRGWVSMRSSCQGQGRDRSLRRLGLGLFQQGTADSDFGSHRCKPD
jgi:hypothetical protein